MPRSGGSRSIPQPRARWLRRRPRAARGQGWSSRRIDGPRQRARSRSSRTAAPRVAPSASSARREIDSLLGFSLADVSLNDNSGNPRDHRLGDGLLRAPADAGNRLRPAGPADDDEPAQLHLGQRRGSLDRITSVRFGDYLNSIPLPAILAVFKAEEWDNFGLMTVNSGLIYSIIDVLLGGRRGQTAVRVEGRPYTTIESNLVKRMVEVVLADAELAFKPLSPVKFNIDRMETNPRFAAISRPANAAILVRLAHRHGGPRRRARAAAALRDDRADPRSASPDVHGGEVRPRPDLGGPSRH